MALKSKIGVTAGRNTVLLFLPNCFGCGGAGLVDEQQKVRTISALAIAALAEAATPYGIESFDSVLKPLWKGIRQHRGKVRYLGLLLSANSTLAARDNMPLNNK